VDRRKKINRGSLHLERKCGNPCDRKGEGLPAKTSNKQTGWGRFEGHPTWRLRYKKRITGVTGKKAGRRTQVKDFLWQVCYRDYQNSGPILERGKKNGSGEFGKK